MDGSGAQLAEYLYGTGIDEPIRMQRGTAKTYFLQDGLGSVTHLTDRNGAIVEQYTYDPYGKPTILDATGAPLTTSAFGNRLLFTGREYDQETGLYYNRARYWSPLIGRFFQRDPLGYFDGPNPYTYVHNNPVNFVEPFGLYDSPVPFGNQAIEAAIGKKIKEKSPGMPDELKKKAAKALREEMTAEELAKLKDPKLCEEDAAKIFDGIINRGKEKPEYQELLKELDPYL